MAEWLFEAASSLTVAGPRRIRTGLPCYAPRGHPNKTWVIPRRRPRRQIPLARERRCRRSSRHDRRCPQPSPACGRRRSGRRCWQHARSRCRAWYRAQASPDKPLHLSAGKTGDSARVAKTVAAEERRRHAAALLRQGAARMPRHRRPRGPRSERLDRGSPEPLFDETARRRDEIRKFVHAFYCPQRVDSYSTKPAPLHLYARQRIDIEAPVETR